MPWILGSKPDSNKDENVSSPKEPCKYDSLVGNTPYASKDRLGCHPRNTLEKIDAIKQSTNIVCPDDALSGFPIKELEQYDNKELAYIVEVTWRIINELQRLIDEKMSGELYRYYVYNEHPCEQRLIAIGYNYPHQGFENKNQNNNIGNLITTLHYHRPQLGDEVKTLYDGLVRKAKETDDYYRRLSELPYWNEKHFNPTKVKQCAEALRKKLLHIQSLFYTDLKAEKPAEIQQSQRTEIPSEIKLMKQIAEHLRIWFREHPDDKHYPSGTVPLRFRNGISLKLEFEVYLDQVLTWLRVNDQKKIARSLEQKRDSFLSDLQAVEQAIERGDNPPLELIELRSKITGLIGTLEHTAKVFTDKLATEKPAQTEQDIEPAKRRGIRAWLRRHPHSYGLTGGIIFLILFFVLGLFKSQWRQWCWGVAGLAFLVLVLSLLGGRSR